MVLRWYLVYFQIQDERGAYKRGALIRMRKLIPYWVWWHWRGRILVVFWCELWTRDSDIWFLDNTNISPQPYEHVCWSNRTLYSSGKTLCQLPHPLCVWMKHNGKLGKKSKFQSYGDTKCNIRSPQPKLEKTWVDGFWLEI